MKIETLENPDQALIEFLDQKISEYNWQHWEVQERKPIAVQLKNEQGEIIAGSAGRTFGNWLMINTLWVSTEVRGQNIGQQVLSAMEEAAKERGCVKCLLDTLNFQAQPFYEKYGYVTQWVQEDYPKTGCRYYMVKRL